MTVGEAFCTLAWNLVLVSLWVYMTQLVVFFVGNFIISTVRFVLFILINSAV